MIVGGGSAGAVLASRLSENVDRTVALLEAGSDSLPESAREPGEWRNLPGSEVDWGYSTVAQEHANQRQIAYPRGKAVGGSSAINGMMHVWPQPEDFQDWPASASVSWQFEDILPFLQKSETYIGAAGTVRRGSAGPLRVQEEPANADTDAALDAFASIRNTWIGRFPLAIAHDVRVTVADAYLPSKVRDRSNLTLLDNATATRLLFNNAGERCIGVEYARGGDTHVILARREVILSAGVIGTPQLLQVSGIGDAALLKSLHIPLVVDAPEVGRNLRDHPLLVMVYPSKWPLQPAAQRVEAGALIFSSEDAAEPDLQLFVMNNVASNGQTAFCIGVSVIKPESIGTVSIRSANVATPPAIDPNLLGQAEDVKRLIAGVGLVRGLATNTALARYMMFEAVPGLQADTDSDLEHRIREAVGFYWHGVGTARMGEDASAVVDAELRVRGVAGLRVADAAVMPTIVRANTNATVLAIAERAAKFIAAAQ
ncbi:GMC family oxidoreductase [Curtobacterium sp. MCBA15_008]|uniref:GMC family oxidoreductase n=1 Tax=Curtobacterium sp. MCBA15_008 TaxID=1898736 RepID=UPI001587ECCA|nr:GMC family oxidoreductase N-terminal domain-containing protein [Curtobacterium sp. MCBA15_008]